MTDPLPPLDLSPLESDYEIVGELGTRGDARLFMATRRQSATKRRDDDPRVLISVVSTPGGDEGNALAHLASDIQQFSQLFHRRLVPIVEGRWLGKDSFAVVSQRTNDASLSECIAKGEAFSSPRIAAILREVSGVIDWARDQQIVHRTVTTDGVFLEPKTDRVRVFFSVEPIHRIRATDVAEDARTMAKLAMAMLTGNEDANAEDARRLADVRDDLPEQLGEALAALLDEKSAATSKDVASFLSLIGMADPLVAGESERERIRAEILEEQRVEREKLAAERANFEQEMASERATFEHLVAVERAKFAHEMETARNTFAAESAEARSAFEKEVAEERARHATQKAELQRAAEQERLDLIARREVLEREVTAQKAELTRVARLDRELVQRLRAQLMAAGELEVEKKRAAALEDISDEPSVLDDAALAVPAFVAPVISPLQELEFDDDTPLMLDTAEVEVPVHPGAVPASHEAANGTLARSSYAGFGIPVGVVAASILLASVIVVRHRSEKVASGGDVTRPVTSAAAPAVAMPARAPAAPAIDSAAILRAAAAESAQVADSLKAAAERRAARRAAARKDSLARVRADSIRRVRDSLSIYGQPDSVKPPAER